MSDRDLKCVHCFEDQRKYGDMTDAKFIFDGMSLCYDHYWQHRDALIDYDSSSKIETERARVKRR